MKFGLIKLEIGKIYQLNYTYCNIYEDIKGSIPIYTMKKGELFVPLRLSVFKNSSLIVPQYKIICNDVVGWLDAENYLDGYLKKMI